MNEIKLFTPDEANALIPFLEEKILQLRAFRNLLASMEIEIDALELITEKDADGKSSRLEQKVATYYQKVDDFYGIVEAIHERGCLMKDVDLGLVDFYMMHEGKVVFLCWKSGETKAGHWHEIHGGFIHRKPLSFQPPGPENPPA